MIEVRQTDEFSDWLHSLKDIQAKARIVSRVRRFSLGNLGDVKPVGQGVSEARLDYGPGYRLYFVQRGAVVILLLCGGTKKGQQADIEKAKALAEVYE
ncbi:type II toxin-antitoxin system RelE/ParE family toxin [Asticcacaulis sp. EMRT-3]|uniref:type II toxin-antitoxin system RelE/ParE family toxin n=1 Tax=Asticcacaulis sp. EMRT-3 TaxID=3040349 RepID=UPI0024AF55A5|nr:type II toxin-antitoxin system RelE/ParE family toxin [Asticcacaulis sp. EMRT-3]MDI7775503.1 type II toxin-antitoxin system RelE/ParE family toxin [Asticcacaulis sp. EMRT-3]